MERRGAGDPHRGVVARTAAFPSGPERLCGTSRVRGALRAHPGRPGPELAAALAKTALSACRRTPSSRGVSSSAA